MFGFSVLVSYIIGDCDCWSCNFNRQNELGTTIGAFELLAGGVLEAAANFGAACGVECSLCWNNSGSPPAHGKWLIAGSATRLTDDVDVPILSSTLTL